MQDHNGSSVLNNFSPTSSASLLASLPLVSNTYGRVTAQPQVVEREGEFGFEWLISWRPPRLSVQRMQCVCFAALISVGLRDGSTQTLPYMSLPHCITFVIVPDPAPSWSPSSLKLAPVRIVMGTIVTLQLQATDDNPDDSIRLESLTTPANLPSFVRIAPGTAISVNRKSQAVSIISKQLRIPSQVTTRSRHPPRRSSLADLLIPRLGDLSQLSRPTSLSFHSLVMEAKTSRFVSKPWILPVKLLQGPCCRNNRQLAQSFACKLWSLAAFTGEEQHIVR